MIRVERLVVPAPKSSFSSNSTRRPPRAHSRAIATPLIPPPMTMISNRSGSGGRGVVPGTLCWMQVEGSESYLPVTSMFIASCRPPNTSIYTVGMTTGERFERAVGIMHRLRAPGGCPWDREQTFDTIKQYTLEETYEVLEAIENRDWKELPGELGDLLLQVLFYAEMAGEEGTFTIDEVLD